MPKARRCTSRLLALTPEKSIKMRVNTPKIVSQVASQIPLIQTVWANPSAQSGVSSHTYKERVRPRRHTTHALCCVPCFHFSTPSISIVTPHWWSHLSACKHLRPQEQSIVQQRRPTRPELFSETLSKCVRLGVPTSRSSENGGPGPRRGGRGPLTLGSSAGLWSFLGYKTETSQ